MYMLLITHIIIALASLVSTGISFVLPSEHKLQISYALIAGTLTSGTVLVVSSHAAVAPSCLTGLVYTAVVLTGVIAAHTRLARAKAKNR